MATTVPAMKIFDWMQNKLNGKGVSEKPNSKLVDKNTMPARRSKEEFNDWPNCLLAIGTLGNENLKEDNNAEDLTSKKVETLQKELNSLLDKHADDESTTDAELKQSPNYLELEKFLRTGQSSFKTGERNQKSDEVNDKSAGFQLSSTGVILSRGKDVCLDQNKNDGIDEKKSFSFLLKKLFVCRNGFELPVPSLRHPIPESRSKKILRALLHKKMYPQSWTPSLPGKKYLEKRHMPKFNEEDEEAFEKTYAGSKWVKTDSEYIVLEI